MANNAMTLPDHIRDKLALMTNEEFLQAIMGTEENVIRIGDIVEARYHRLRDAALSRIAGQVESIGQG